MHDAADIRSDLMPALANVRHERFARELSGGKTASEAYELAGFKASRPNASRLQHQENIRQRVAELHAQGAEIAQKATEKAAERLSVDREWVMARLKDNAVSAAAKEDYGPSNRAIELLGKEIGMFIDRKEVRTGALDGLDARQRDQLRDALQRELDRRDAATGAAGEEGPPVEVRAVH